MGVGAVFLSMVAKEEMEEIYKDQVEKPVIIELISPVVLFIVLSSTLVHGTTIPLFQLGKRIRTRTLSITSTSSNNVVRLPKIQLGQQLSFRRSQQDLEDANTMSETQRNTLINTIERKKEEEAKQAADDHAAIDMEDDDTAEEDFLPGGESDGDERPPPPAAAETPTNRGSTMNGTNNELQSIRFLEPVKPRSTSQANIEKNEASVSSLRSWLHRNRSEETPMNNNSSSNNDCVPNSSSLRNMFRRHHKDHNTPPPAQHQQPHSEKEAEQVADIPGVPEQEAEAAEEEYHSKSHIHPRIEVWEENNDIVIEDTAETGPQIVLDKQDPNWKQKARETVKDLEQAIAGEQSKSHQHRWSTKYHL